MTEFMVGLVRLETLLWNELDRRLTSAGLVPMATLLALSILHRYDGSPRVEELRSGLDITAGAASKLAARLERGGLIRRLPHPSDGRASLLVLTPRGTSALIKATGAVDAAVAELLPGGAADEYAAGAARLLEALGGRVTGGRTAR